MRTIKYILALLAVLTGSFSNACTSFTIKTDSEYIFGRNYDFMIGYGYVFINKKDVLKSPFSSAGSAAQWVSKYGSVTFNQFGREFPTGGINEAGLVVELMWLDDTKYPENDGRPTTGGVLQWIQYQLDNCETVQEVIDTDKEIRIPDGSVPLHFLVADKYGRSATIEFLEGKMVVHQGQELEHPVLTNDTYAKSLKFFNSVSQTGGIQERNFEKTSLNRFAKTCSMVENYKKQYGRTAVDYGFEVLSEVSQDQFTKWSIVYDIKNMKVFYKTFDNENLRYIDLAEADFNCITPVKMIDINEDSGKVNAEMSEYTYKTNRELIDDSYNGVDFLKNTPEEVRERNAQYPERLECRSKSSNEQEGGSIDKKSFHSMYIIGAGIVIAAGLICGFSLRRKSINNS